jgi:hypothetical protein
MKHRKKKVDDLDCKSELQQHFDSIYNIHKSHKLPRKRAPYGYGNRIRSCKRQNWAANRVTLSQAKQLNHYH